MDEVVIRTESPADNGAVDDVVRRAFVEQPEVADMVVAVRSSPGYRPELTLVAERAGAVCGFVMLSGVELVDDAGRRTPILTLSPLAVAPDHQGLGIGAGLVGAAVSAADRAGEPLVVLEGSPHYYGRLGFRFAPDHGITIDLPSWAPPEAAQVYLLSGYRSGLDGRVCYPPAIAAVSG